MSLENLYFLLYIDWVSLVLPCKTNFSQYFNDSRRKELSKYTRFLYMYILPWLLIESAANCLYILKINIRHLTEYLFSTIGMETIYRVFCR